jgi:branched-chain amino acid transport system substrate-binding protein
LKALAEQGWDGVKVNVSGTSGNQWIEAAGEAANGVYLGVTDVASENATEIQKELVKKAKEEINETLSAVSLQPWEAIMALKAAIEKAGTLDSEKLKDIMSTIVIESTYGPAMFGLEDFYGSPQQLLVPVGVTQIQNGTAKELSRVIPEELKEKLEKKE